MIDSYQDTRSNIKSGDVLAWTTGSWLTLHGIMMNLIKIFTMSEYNHVGVAWVTGGRVFVIEATIPLVRIIPLSRRTPFYHIPCGETYWDTKVEEFFLSKVGDKYSKIDAVKAFLKTLTLGKNNKWQCAELVSTGLNNSGKFNRQFTAIPSELVRDLLLDDFKLTLVS